ncbi:MAG: glutamine amidotransferase subunit PdxT [Chloroflexi bacterium RBG_13_54_8]|nr:MAG: glutamine amidotransferase subunit PdxT [Chloroflexi bacterium RBG_13_54_8]
MRIGVLALQGAFIEHIRVLRQLDVEASTVYLPSDLEGLDGIIIPGGESTTISRLMLEFGLTKPLKDLAEGGLPVWGTCAGMILLAKEVCDDSRVETLGLMDIKVKRNAFGRQADSFETDIEMPVLGEGPFNAVFIRAPIIEEVGRGVEVLASLSGGVVVAARQGNLVASAFHPELTTDPRFHRYFLDIVASGPK